MAGHMRAHTSATSMKLRKSCDQLGSVFIRFLSI